MTIKIGDFKIGEGRSFIIAEIGNNHNGDVELAIEMIDLAKSAGADCVKFQLRHMNEVYRHRSLTKAGDDLGSEYVIDLLKRFNLSVNDHIKISNYCSQSDIIYMCTPWDKMSVLTLEELSVPAYKVASADLTNTPLLRTLVKTKKPMIVSTGMSTLQEIKEATEFLNQHTVDFIIMHCNSTYPAPLEDINLRLMNTLRSVHPYVGYSGHERGPYIGFAAAAMGACIIEKHFTLDRSMEGPDHAASLNYKEFSELVLGVRQIERALGDEKETREISQGEMINREVLGKSIVSSRLLKKGSVISHEDVKIMSPGQGLSPNKLNELIGSTLQRDMKEEDFFFNSDIKQTKTKRLSNYNFSRPWGLPVRYHDFQEYKDSIETDFWEFHLSYSDMELNIRDYLSPCENTDFAVHAPELFSGSMLMDLASPDNQTRKKSVSETQRVIQITHELKEFFPKTKRPLIIANIGGFSMDNPLTESEIIDRYANFERSLAELDLNGVELIPQTMAPFPWHFGGQRYQNLFLDPEDILSHCKALNLRVCFDVSHSKLACNHFGLNFSEFATKIAPVTAHLHLGDASGVNGEGTQIGSGEIDFLELGKILNKLCPEAPFIPEIWQGHKNKGEGFWIALEKLNGLV